MDKRGCWPGTDPSPVIIIISPHLDDAVFSAFGILHAGRAGDIEVATLVTEPGKEWSPDWGKATGFANGDDEFANRRREDAHAMSLAGVSYRHLGGVSDNVPGSKHLLESYIEGMLSASHDLTILLPAAAGGALPPCNTKRLRDRMLRRPSGASSHPDHTCVRDVMIALIMRHGISRYGFYLDIPYAWNDSAHRLAAELEQMTGRALLHSERRIDIGLKLQACEAYASQVELILGKKASWRRRVLSMKEQYLLTAEAAKDLQP